MQKIQKGQQMFRRKFFYWVSAFTLSILINPAYPLQEKKITIDWGNGDQCKRLTELPQYWWLEDGTAYVSDPSEDPNDKTIEKFDPRTGKRKSAVNKEKALESLDKLLNKNTSRQFCWWPASFDNEGRYALYEFDNDIFLLDVNKSQFRRITNTDAAEKAIRFAPDGKKIAYVRSNNLYVYDIEKESEKQITQDGSDTILNGTISYVYWEEIFGREDCGYWWSEDSNSIAYLKTDESPVPLVYFIDYKPQTPRLLTQRYPKAGQQNPIVRLYAADVNGNQLSQLNSSEIPYEYIARVKWLPDNKRLCVETLNRNQTRLDIYFMDRDTGRTELIFTERDSGWVEMTDDLYFLKDGRHFIWLSRRDGFAHLFLYTIDGQLVRQITKGKWSVCSICSTPFWILNSIAYIDEDGQWIYFGSKQKSPIEQHLCKIKFDGTALQQITQEDGTHKIIFSKNGKYYFDIYSSITTPPAMTLYSIDGKKKMVIGQSKTENIDNLSLQYPLLTTVTARDGFEMPAMLSRPKDFDAAKKYPVIIYVYGGPGAPVVSNNWQSSIFTDQILLDNGFLIFKFNNRSSTAISKTLSNLVTGQMWAECELNDLVDAARWLKAQSYVDGNNIGLWGASGGGSYTLLGLTHSKEFKAGVAVSAVTDWMYYDSIWAEAGMKLPQDNPKGYEKTSLVKHAKDLHGRLLLVHGTYDDNVHPQNAWAFADALIDAGITFDMFIYPMRKHGISDKPAKIHLFNTMLEFWNRNLKQ
jgi:dipeptidyl-peptidase 4